MKTRTWLGGLAILMLASLGYVGDSVVAAAAEIKAQPGELVIDHPTLINLGFEPDASRCFRMTQS